MMSSVIGFLLFLVVCAHSCASVMPVSSATSATQIHLSTILCYPAAKTIQGSKIHLKTPLAVWCTKPERLWPHKPILNSGYRWCTVCNKAAKRLVAYSDWQMHYVIRFHGPVSILSVTSIITMPGKKETLSMAELTHCILCWCEVARGKWRPDLYSP